MQKMSLLLIFMAQMIETIHGSIDNNVAMQANYSTASKLAYSVQRDGTEI